MPNLYGLPVTGMFVTGRTVAGSIRVTLPFGSASVPGWLTQIEPVAAAMSPPVVWVNVVATTVFVSGSIFETFPSRSTTHTCVASTATPTALMIGMVAAVELVSGSIRCTVPS